MPACSMMTAPTICSVHWKIWMRIKISNLKRICSPSGRFARNVLSPVWIPPAKHWRYPLGNTARSICLIWLTCWVHPVIMGVSPPSCLVLFSKILPLMQTTRKPAGKLRTNTFPVMCAINCAWHNLLQKAARSSGSMWMR